MTSNDMRVWVRTARLKADSPYQVVVSVETKASDILRAMTTDEAVQYAHAVGAIAARATYEGAVVQRSRSMGIPDEATAELLVPLRNARPEIDGSLHAPLTMRVGVNESGEGFITLFHAGELLGQWDPAQARIHSMAVLEATEFAVQDQLMLGLLQTIVELDEATATSFIGSLTDLDD